jgi:hypothetical protein
MIVDTWLGLTIHITRVHHGPLSLLRRRWEWWIEGTREVVDGRAWTWWQALAHARTCRALMLAARSPVATRRSQDDLEGWRTP